MLLKRLIPHRGGPVPNLVIAQRVVDKMLRAANRHVADETGEAMIGVITSGAATKSAPQGVGDNPVPTIYVLDTIAPDETDVVREHYTFQQGDERQYEIFTWLNENWDVLREKRSASYGTANQAKWDVPLCHLGDWHKQPGFMIEPSGGDLQSALDQLDDLQNQQNFLLVPIVTLGHPSTVQDGTGVNYLSVPTEDGTNMRVDFWYIHRDVGVFQPIIPTVYPDDQLPQLTVYPWHLKDEARAREEFGLFQDHDMFVSVLLWDTDDTLPLEVVIVAARRGAKQVYLIVTPWNFPEEPPLLLSAPYLGLKPDEDIYDVFEQWWVKSETLDNPPGWKWTPDKFLYDYVAAVEKHLGLTIAQTDPPNDPKSDQTDDSSPENQPQHGEVNQ